MTKSAEEIEQMLDRLGCGQHSWVIHRAPLRCETCGLDTRRCSCPKEEIRLWKCLECGFRMTVGGRSIIEMLTPKANPQ